jgi:ribosomal protein S18 acetylase RimI-like enzyme
MANMRISRDDLSGPKISALLRSATACDIPALSRLGIDSFVAKFGHLYRNEDLAAYLAEAHSETSVAAELANPDRLYQIAEQDDALIGYCKLGLIGGFPEHARGTQIIELKQLYTAPNATGQGIGAALMDWALAEARARGVDEMQLSVWSGNDGAQRFYARYGFVKVAEVNFWVGSHRDDEFLFSRLL